MLRVAKRSTVQIGTHCCPHYHERWQYCPWAHRHDDDVAQHGDHTLVNRSTNTGNLGLQRFCLILAIHVMVK